MRLSETLILLGFGGIGTTCSLRCFGRPSVSLEAFESPAAQRIFYWHVPAAWAAFIAFGALFVGSAGWLFKRSVGVEASRRRLGGRSRNRFDGGLVGLCLGCRRMGHTVGLDRRPTQHVWLAHALLSIYVVLGRNSQPDGVESRDTFAAFGLYGFVLVPVTYIATRIWTIRHPGPVVATGGEGSINGDMGLVFFSGAISFTVFIFGHMMASMELTALEQRLERLQDAMDGGD